MSPTSRSAQQRIAGNSAHNAACIGRESEASAISQAAAFFMIYLLQLVITIAWEPIAILELLAPLKPLKLRMIDCYSMANEMDGASESCMQDALPGPEENGFGAGSSSRISLRGAKRVEPPVQGGSWNALQASGHQRPLRINLQELKVKLSKMLGPRKEREYCNLFSSFLSQRLSKAELDKRLLQTIGKDNISLHNQIVKAILSNAICGQVPPPPPPPPAATVLKNLKRRRSEKDGGVSKRSRSSMDDEDSTSVVETELQEELEQDQQEEQEEQDDEEDEEEEIKSRSVLTAPLGIPFCVQSIGGAAAAAAAAPWHEAGRQRLWDEEAGSDFLPSNAGMQRRMERVAIVQAGLQGLNADCANLVNQALDVYLKRLIKECVQLVQSRRPKSIQHPQQQQQQQQQQLGDDHRSKRKSSISARDFKLAMELNPQQLGDNWPIQLERLSLLAFEHQQRQFGAHRDHDQQLQQHL